MGVGESLRNLGVEHIDLYQVHRPDQHVPIETPACSTTFVTEGKIRYARVSNFSAEYRTRAGPRFVRRRWG